MDATADCNYAQQPDRYHCVKAEMYGVITRTLANLKLSGMNSMKLMWREDCLGASDSSYIQIRYGWLKPSVWINTKVGFGNLIQRVTKAWPKFYIFVRLCLHTSVWLCQLDLISRVSHTVSHHHFLKIESSYEMGNIMWYENFLTTSYQCQLTQSTASILRILVTS